MLIIIIFIFLLLFVSSLILKVFFFPVIEFNKFRFRRIRIILLEEDNSHRSER